MSLSIVIMNVFISGFLYLFIYLFNFNVALSNCNWMTKRLPIAGWHIGSHTDIKCATLCLTRNAFGASHISSHCYCHDSATIVPDTKYTYKACQFGKYVDIFNQPIF